MWNTGGDGFDGGYGGQSEGGFMAGQSQFDSPAAKDQTKVRRTQNLVPMTLKNLLECKDEMQLAGMEVNMAIIVGLIKSVDITSTKITYVLDDSTAQMEVVQWIESDGGADESGGSTLMENTYCRVAGSMRTQQEKRYMMAFQIRPLQNLNALTNHLLMVMHATLKLQQVKQIQANGGGNDPMPSSSMSNSLVGVGGQEVCTGSSAVVSGFSGGMMQGLNREQTLVYQAIAQCPDEAGVARRAIYGALTGKVDNRKIDDVLEFLSGEGHIYSTIDDDHFKSTDG